MDKQLVSPCTLREIFDYSSHEYQSLLMPKRIEKLKLLLKNDSNILKLALEMQQECNTTANKDIKDLDLLLSMSKIIEYLLKKEVDSL
jgi:uncharacterized membrane-anchored protein YjiN (DUF445 family)